MTWGFRRSGTLLGMLLISCSGPILATDWTGDANFTIGFTRLDQELEPAEDQVKVGASFNFRLPEWPIMIAVEALASQGDGTSETIISMMPGTLDVEIETAELAFGVRKIWDREKVHPFLGGGIELYAVDVESDIKIPGFATTPLIDDSDTALGIWLDGGVFWRIGKRFNLGFHLRYSDAEATLEEQFTGLRKDLDLSALHYGLLVGWGW